MNDFGVATLILPNQSHVTTELVGTMVYIVPGVSANMDCNNER